MKSLTTLQQKIGYIFQLKSILEEAVTHKSFAHEAISSKAMFTHNERLEYLGDAVLDLGVSTLLMHHDFEASEGELSKRRASLVNEKTLAEVAQTIDLSEYLRLGKGEVLSGGVAKPSILSSALEALVGGVYLDGGYDSAYKIIKRLFSDRVEAIGKGNAGFERDYKSKLQEIVQGKFKLTPRYTVDATEGPEHEKTFFVSVYIGEKKMGEGRGKNRKTAEQDAAQAVIEELKK